jgi:signal transduction histidine kinase
MASRDMGDRPWGRASSRSARGCRSPPPPPPACCSRCCWPGTSRPIRALRQAFDAAANGDLAPRFTSEGGKAGDELNDLGRDFDRMTARLRSLIDGQTRLLHDVSHELRSPLARLQAAIGLAHQQPEKWSASMERIERESVRMDKLVGELLTLARLEAGAIKASQEEISMADLLDQIADDAHYEAPASTAACCRKAKPTCK